MAQTDADTTETGGTAKAGSARLSGVAGFTSGRLAATLGALIIAVLFATLDTTIVATALPTIAGELDAFESFAWVGAAYVVTAAISTPILGKLSDLYGRRTIFQSTMGVFFVGSLLCGIAQTMPQLIAARAVQGVGGGAIQALAFAILGDILSPRDRGRYIGYFTMAFAAAALLGPLVGGFIIERWDWHWIFLINLPLIAIAALATHFTLKLPFTRRSASIDWLGAGMLCLGLGGLMIALEVGKDGWGEPPVVVGLVGGCAVLVLFVWWERRVDEPMIPMRLFANKTVLGTAVMGLFIGSVSYGAFQFMPLFFQDSQFVSPTNSGLRMMPVMFGVVVMSTMCGRLISRTGRYKIFPIAGFAGVLLGLFAVSRITADTSYTMLAIPFAVIGLGSGAIYTTTSIAAQNACELRDLGVTTATIMFFRNLGGSLALAGYGALLNSYTRSTLPERTGLAADDAVALLRTPEDIESLAAGMRTAVVDTISDGVGLIQLVSALTMFVGLYYAVRLPELPLRNVAGITEAMQETAGH
ncbi:MAG: MDR family MFS transporter [Ilumatobacteraceae bacterium]